MQRSDIAWTDMTWNPTHGCSKVSAGCENCYAERISRQYSHTEQPWTNEHAAENVTERPDKLEEPYSLEGSKRVFVNSMSDLFHAAVSDGFIEDALAVMRNCPHHVFQILTKRPGRAAHMPIQWPPNVWLGTSVEDDRVTERIDLLRSCDAATLFVSFEPLIGPVGDVGLSDVDWAIVGGESGPDDDRREMDHEWARAILDQCRRDDVAFFFKQSSARRPETGTALTVKDPEFDVYVQKEIRELPAAHAAVERARSTAREADAATDGGQR
jgi:protein gp37